MSDNKKDAPAKRESGKYKGKVIESFDYRGNHYHEKTEFTTSKKEVFSHLLTTNRIVE